MKCYGTRENLELRSYRWGKKSNFKSAKGGKKGGGGILATSKTKRRKPKGPPVNRGRTEVKHQFCTRGEKNYRN